MRYNRQRALCAPETPPQAACFQTAEGGPMTANMQPKFIFEVIGKKIAYSRALGRKQLA